MRQNGRYDVRVSLRSRIDGDLGGLPDGLTTCDLRECGRYAGKRREAQPRIGSSRPRSACSMPEGGGDWAALVHVGLSHGEQHWG